MNELLVDLQAFQKEVVFVKAKHNNDFTKSKFAKLVDVILDLREPLERHNLWVDQNLTIENGENCLETVIYHTKSDSYKLSVTKLVNNSEILKWGASVTYQRRYAQLVALGLITDGDDDGELADVKKKQAGESLGEKRLAVAQILKGRGIVSFQAQVDEIEKVIGKRKLETAEDAERVLGAFRDVATA